MRLAIRFCLVPGCLAVAVALGFPQALTAIKTSPNDNSGQSGPAEFIYKVKKGDSLYSIARAYGTTVNALKSGNRLRSTRLNIGQRLTVAAGVRTTNGNVTGFRRTKPAADASGTKATANGVFQASPGVDQDVLASWLPALPDFVDANGEPVAQPLRHQLASIGLGFVGVRYRRSGESEKSGFDCSGLVKALFERFEINLPRSSREQFKVGEKVDKDELEVGDLVFFSNRGKARTPSHVGVYIGNNMFVHAAVAARRVLVSNLTKSWYSQRFLGARRFQDLWKDEPKAGDPKSN